MVVQNAEYLGVHGLGLRSGGLEETFLASWGPKHVTRKAFVPGEDHMEELEQVRLTIERLRRESDAGLVVSAEDEGSTSNRRRL